MSCRSVTAHPGLDLGGVPPHVVGSLGHVDPQRVVNRMMAHSQSEDKPSASSFRDQGCALSTDIRMAEVDIGNPGSDLDALGRGAHKLCRGQRVVVHLRTEDRVEPGRLGLARNLLNVACTPARPGYYT